MDNDPVPPSSPPRVSSPIFPDLPFFESHEQALILKSSSPPPLFSSDDSRESIDITNYNTPRIHKNKRKGTWWENHESAHNTPERKRSKFSRNFDSGVFMMSSSDPLSDSDTDDSIAASHGLRPPRRQPTRKLLAPGSTAATEFEMRLQAGLEQNDQTFDFWGLGLGDSDIQQIGELASIIKNPPDPGHDVPAENQFRSMDPELFLQLGHNKLCRLPPSLFTVHGLTSLSLRENQIVELPQQLGQLKHLQVLDVSLNKLRYLPVEILQLLRPHGSLRRLHTMGNPLIEPMSTERFMHEQCSLPIEISDVPEMCMESACPALDGLQFQAAIMVPRLYRELEAASDKTAKLWQICYWESWGNAFGGDDRKDEDEHLQDEGVYPHHPTLELDNMIDKAPRYMARMLVSFFDQAGNLFDTSPRLPNEHELNHRDCAVILESKRGAYGVPSSPWFVPPSLPHVPSLLTTSLHNAFKKRHDGNFTIEDIRGMLQNQAPHDSEGIFKRAIENEAGGWGEFRQCHVCGKEYVVARAEWIEFWSVGYAIFYPLKVSVCSWACVPVEMVKKPEQELMI